MALIATFSGPLYSFAVIWLGYYLMTRAPIRTQSVGFALIVSSMPFSRILTPLLGSGDEVFGFTRLGMDKALAWPLAIALTFGLATPPVVKIYKSIENRRKLLWIVGLLLVPFFAIGAVVFGILQAGLLKRGVLAEDWILGSPMLVSVWLFTSAVVFAVFARHVPTLLQPTDVAGHARNA